MSGFNYMEDKKVRDCYEKWALNPVLHGVEKEYFYKFVKACLEVDKSPSIDKLKLALYDSFHAQYSEERYDEFQYETVVLFEHLRNFHNTTLP